MTLHPPRLPRLLIAALLLTMVCAGLGAAVPPSASANVAFRNASCNTKTNSFGIPPYTIAINKPTGVVAGDLLIATTKYSAFYSSVNTPSGWTELQGNGQDTTTWYKIAAAGDASSYSFTMPSGPGSAVGIISAFSGVSSASPLVDDGVQTTSGTASSVALPNVTGQRAGSMRYSVVASGAAVSSTWAGMTEACDTTVGSMAVAGASEPTGIGVTTSRTDARSGTGSNVAQTYVIQPAGACETSGLTLTPPASIAFPATTLNGLDRSLTSTATLTVDDQTGTGAGWNVSGTSTTFTNGGFTIPVGATAITSVDSVPAAGNCTATAANTVTYPVFLPAGTTAPPAAKLFSAAAGSGMGPVTLTMHTGLLLPAKTHVGTYSSTWTLTLSAGP